VGLPSLRLRGDYLAIVTLGFGEIIRVVVQNTEAFGRALGLSGIPQHSSLFMIWFWVFLTVLVARRIAASAHGRSLWAIREDEIAAEAMGVNTTAYKVRAFVISSFFAGVAGGLFAHFVPIINPGSFTFVRSMEIVVMVVLGGLGSTTGAIVAATFLTLLPEVLRSLFTALGSGDESLAQRADQIRMPIYGMLLVVLMLVRPQGLFGTKEIWDVLPRWIPRKRKGLA
jgi:branched-chain amino acid transport system permease protein